MLFKYSYLMSSTGELLCTCHACGARANNGDTFAGIVILWQGLNPTVFPTFIDNSALNSLDGYGLVGNV